MSASDSANDPVELIVHPDEVGLRLDSFLVAHFASHSRTQLKRAIAASAVQVDGHSAKASFHLKEGQRVIVLLPDLPHEGPIPEDIPLDIIYEDESIIAVNKAAGMVVHPAKGHWQGTLTSALAFHFEQLSSVGGPTRPGIVHRLDRETSGVMIVAKTDAAHWALSKQFEQRTTEKEYFAIVAGVPDHDRDIIKQPIGAHPYQREKKAIRANHSTSRDASTMYEISERFDRFAAVKVLPKTGRTHQIRIHMAHIGCPVLCDRLYGGRASITAGEIRRDREDQDVLLDRLALHALRLKLTHPDTGQPIEFNAPLPDDISGLLEALRTFRK